jgi:crotonobetainyl-CoA:carnitine CoA-transferase CaiB-like acyl-CoA transferase
MDDPQTSTALSGITVLDLTRVRAGPTCVRQFADWGANVIKIELPPKEGEVGLGGPRHGPDFQNLHRNKRSMTLNLKSAKGIELFKRLVAKADVIVENYRPDVKNRLGIDYASMREVNPRIVYGSISGFGQDGPYVGRPGVDQIAQGMGGLMSITGLPGQGPVRVGIPIADLTSGMFCAFGILTALLEREVSGEGQWVHSSLVESQIFMLDFQASRWTVKGEVAPQAGNNHPTIIPTGVFKTADGHINLAPAGDTMYRRFCGVLGADELLSDERFSTPANRLENRDALNAAIDAYTVKASSDHWVQTMNDAGVPCGPIYQMDEMFADPQVQHLQMATPVQHPTLGQLDVVNQAVSMSRTKSVIDVPSPECGEHTDEILAEFGLNAREIQALKSAAAV